MEKKTLKNFEIVNPAIRHYYAKVNHLGDCTYNSPGWRFISFDSKVERDKWVEEHEMENGRPIALSTTRKTIERVKGKNFIIEADMCWRNKDEWMAELDRMDAVGE